MSNEAHIKPTVAEMHRELWQPRPRLPDGRCIGFSPLEMTTTLEPCAAPGGVKALFRRNDRLLLDGDPRAECLWTGNFIDAPWTFTLSDRTRLVVLNRGAHYEDDASALAAWAAALRAARKAAPHALIVARTTPTGHEHCDDYMRPIVAPNVPRWREQEHYSWLLFPVGSNSITYPFS